MKSFNCKGDHVCVILALIIQNRDSYHHRVPSHLTRLESNLPSNFISHHMADAQIDRFLYGIGKRKDKNDDFPREKYKKGKSDSLAG